MKIRRRLVTVLGVLVVLLLGSGASAMDEVYKRQLDNARRQLLRGRTAEAAKIFEGLLVKEPHELQASVGYAEALISLSRFDEARAVIDTALATNAQTADLHRMSVKLHRAKNEPGAAFDAVLRVMEADRERATWAFQESRQLLMEGLDAEAAGTRVAASRAKHPGDLDYPVLEALLAALDGRPQVGLDLVVRLETEMAIQGRVALRYAEELQGMGYDRESLAAYAVAAERTPNAAHRSRILFQVAELHERLGNYREALESLAVIAGDREGQTASGKALLKSADIYQTYLDDTQGALAVYERLKDNPILGHHRPEMLLQMGECYVRLGRLEEAAATYNAVIPEALDPEQAELAAFRSAEVSFFSGNVDTALVLFQRMAETYPRSLLADDAAHRYILLNKHVVSGSRAPLERFGRMEWARLVGDSAVVDSSARAIIDELPQGELAAESWMALSELGVAAGDYEEALAALDHVVREHDWDVERAPAALKRQGDLLLERLDRPQEALLRYETILTDYPGSVLAGEARRLVERLRRELKS